MNNRRGFSLIEMVAAIGTITILAGLSVTLIGLLLRVERLERASLVQQHTLARLSREFRFDVRSSESTDPFDGAVREVARIVLRRSAADSMEYQIKGDLIVRSQRDSDKIVQTDTFKLPLGASARIELSGQPGQAIVSLRVDRKAGKHGAGNSREFRVDARLGRDQRFVGVGD